MTQTVEYTPEVETKASATESVNTQSEKTSTSTEIVTLEGFALPEIVKAFSAERGLDPLIEKIKHRVRTEHMDVTTEEGRARIGSVARQIGQTKMELKRTAQGLTEDWRNKTKAVTSETTRMEKELDALRDEVLAPREEFERIEKERVQRHQTRLENLVSLSTFIGFDPTSAQVQERIDTLSTIMDKDYDWQEFAAKAADASGHVEKALAEMIVKRKKAEDDAAELERLRKAEEVRLQKERDDRIAAEAAAKAKDDAIKAEADKKAAAEAAAKAERDRQAEEQRKQKESDDKRAADQAHRRKINGEVMADLLKILNEQTTGAEEKAKDIIKAIVSGQVRHTTIKY